MREDWTPYTDWIKLDTGTARFTDAEGSGDFKTIWTGSAVAAKGRRRLEATFVKYSIEIES
jgi:hypothetical protein